MTQLYIVALSHLAGYALTPKSTCRSRAEPCLRPSPAVGRMSRWELAQIIIILFLSQHPLHLWPIRPMMQKGAAAGATKRQWAKTGLALGSVSHWHATEFLSEVLKRPVTGMQEHAAFFDAPNKPSDLELY